MAGVNLFQTVSDHLRFDKWGKYSVQRKNKAIPNHRQPEHSEFVMMSDSGQV
jgi:hypothetical protein